jgi:hypothetical protein
MFKVCDMILNKVYKKAKKTANSTQRGEDNSLTIAIVALFQLITIVQLSLLPSKYIKKLEEIL